MKLNSKFRRQIWLVLPLILFLLILSSCTASPAIPSTPTNTVAVAATSAIPSDGWMVPVDASPAHPTPTPATQTAYLDLAWKSFIAFNWPAVTGAGAYPGQPNKNMNITDPAAINGPTVWQTWMVPEQIFLAGAANPGTWNAPTVSQLMQKDPASGEMLPVIGGLVKPDARDASLDPVYDQAFTNSPLIDQQGNYVAYDVRMNESEFTYISLTQYYNAQNQINAVNANPNTFVGFPRTGKDLPPAATPVTLNDWAQFGATELKVSWRVLVDGKDDFSRYYTMRAYVALPNGGTAGPYTMGLVGFHILRLTPSTPSTWFWATFEQIDNLTPPSGSSAMASFNNGSTANCQQNGYDYQPTPITYGTPLPTGTPVNVCRTTTIPLDVAALNVVYQEKLVGTPWQYYQMVNTLNPMLNGPCSVSAQGTPGASMNTCDMVNVTLETYSQVSTQCNTCHQFGFPQGTVTPADASDLQIFTFLLSHAQDPSSTSYKIKLPAIPTATPTP